MATYRYFLRLLPVILLAFTAGIATHAEAQTGLQSGLQANAPVSLQTTLDTAPDYEIKNVVVDITSNNAVEARKQAFIEAQSKAFVRMAKQLRPDLPENEIKKPDSASLSRMIRDFEIASEHLSTTRYRGNFTFRFDPAQTASFLQIPTTMQQAQQVALPVQGSGIIPGKLLLVPFWQNGNQFILWGEQNPLRKSFQATRTLPARVVLPRGDTVDTDYIRDNQALTYDPQRLRSLANRYQAERAVILMGTPNISYEGGGAGVVKSMTVGIYDTLSGKPAYVDQILVPTEGGDTMDTLTARAIQMTLPRINGLPTGENYSAVAPVTTPQQAPVYAGQTVAQTITQQQSIKILARFSTLTQWASMQVALRAMPELSAISIRNVGMGNAELDASLSGSINAVQTTLARSGFSLNAQGGTTYVLTPNSYGQRG